MTDRYQQFARSGIGKLVISRLGLPDPVPLRRFQPGQALLAGPALVGAAEGGRLAETVSAILTNADVHTTADDDTRYGALVFDATGIDSPDRLRELYEFFHPVIRQLAASGR